MDHSNKIILQNDVNKTLITPKVQLFCMPLNSMTKENVTTTLDVNLYNLKRAYNVSLESHEDLMCPGEKSLLKTEFNEEGDLTTHHPLEFCESQINEKDDDSSSYTSDSECKCSYCNFEGTAPELQNHIKHYHPYECTKTNWCERCLMSFKNEIAFKQHQTQEHKDFCCKQCNRSFQKRRLLVAHLPVHSEDKCFKCPTCGKVFPTHRNFVRHLERHEKQFEITPESRKLEYKCTVCQKNFTKKESLIKHMRIHTRESFKCSLCDFTCGKKVTLKMHFIFHEGSRKYKCNNCDFSFKQIGHLKRHILRFNH